MSTISEADRERIEARYAKPRTPHWLVVTAVVVVATLLTGYWVWVSLHHSNPPLSADVSSFRVVSDDTIDVDVLIDRASPEQSGSCLVYVQAINYERVGEVMVRVPPSSQKIDRTTVTVHTIRRAMAAAVDHCTAD